jgi:hypothetical protein
MFLHRFQGSRLPAWQHNSLHRWRTLHLMHALQLLLLLLWRLVLQQERLQQLLCCCLTTSNSLGAHGSQTYLLQPAPSSSSSSSSAAAAASPSAAAVRITTHVKVKTAGSKLACGQSSAHPSHQHVPGPCRE